MVRIRESSRVRDCWGGGAVSQIMRRFLRWLLVSVALVAGLGGISFSQEHPEEGGHEIQWTGGGHSVPGGTKNTGVWNLGVRYGWILTRPHGPGFPKGRFEYAVDAVPVFLVFQPANTSYGAGFNPIDLKWDFATRGSIVPYLEIDGGTLVHQPHGADRDERSEFYDEWRFWDSLARRTAQLEHRSALHAHFQRRSGHSESGD